jgi:hypothetical protein
MSWSQARRGRKAARPPPKGCVCFTGECDPKLLPRRKMIIPRVGLSMGPFQNSARKSNAMPTKAVFQHRANARNRIRFPSSQTSQRRLKSQVIARGIGKSSPTISATPVGAGVACQPLIHNGEQSGLRTHVAATESGHCAR